MWKLPNGRIIKSPIDVEIGDIKHSKSIFVRWPVEELNAIGVYPFSEESYDSRHYISEGSVDDVVEGRVIRRHTLKRRFTAAKLRQRFVKELRKSFRECLREAINEINYLTEFEPNNTNELAEWTQYCTDLKAAGVAIKADIQAITSYAEAIEYIRDGFKQHWPTKPDEEPIT